MQGKGDGMLTDRLTVHGVRTGAEGVPRIEHDALLFAIAIRHKASDFLLCL